MSLRKTRQSRGFLALAVLAIFVFAGTGLARELREVPLPEFDGSRPALVWGLHNLGNVWSAFLNLGRFGDPNANYPSMEWPGGSGSSYLWVGNVWSCCYGRITSTWPDSAGKWASCSDYGDWEFWPSEGFPMEKLVPGPVSLEQTQYGYDDWYEKSSYQEDPYGLMVWEENYSWGTPGYNEFIANKLVFTHHSQYGNPAAPLDGILVGIRGDCDVATADPVSCAIEDLVYYDGHAIWYNPSAGDSVPAFEYQFDDGILASEQDEYTYQQNPDSPLDPDDPNNIWYYYNYKGEDGILDNDVDGNGVSDHFTILFQYPTAGGDTLYPVNQGTGIEMFTPGNCPEHFWHHVVGDTTFAVIPRNMSYMWDGDGAGSSVDDSGEQELDVPAVGFIGWRLLDCYIVKASGDTLRPIDVYNVPIPISHAWWNWESDPGTDIERYDYMWGVFPDEDGQFSGPAYLADWVGNENTPLARESQNPGPWPFVYDNPLGLGYPTFDYRFLPSMGPVNLEDGDSLYVYGGWVVASGLEGCRRAADELLSAYYLEGSWGVPDLPPAPILFYEAQDNAVHLEWGANAETYSPFGGYHIYRASFEPSNWEHIADVDATVHSYTDNTARNGFPYYYVVTASDAVTGIESTKSNYKQTVEGTPVAVVPSWDTDSNWTENVRVVPNPYKISAAWEQTYFNKIAFINLPSMCDIHIFTLAGDHVVTLEHRDYTGENGTEYWDLVSRNDQDVVTGLYVYRVETADDFVIDKFAIIK
ncbi:hypothetical protein CSA37_02330 [Candidatus Fermentibacteria bacterium]|nr:MAG: hypothetical protein CSA37_02330 [Candidatus Fermentibacteria bacterium]